MVKRQALDCVCLLKAKQHGKLLLESQTKIRAMKIETRKMRMV